MAKTKEDIYRDKLSHLHDQLTVQGYRLQKIFQACGQDYGPLVDLVTREQAAKLLGISLRAFDRINAKIQFASKNCRRASCQQRYGGQLSEGKRIEIETEKGPFRSIT